MASEQNILMTRPGVEIDTVYSNSDHEMDYDVVKRLDEGDCYSSHTAWDFCGYVWRLPDGRWVDQIWQYKEAVADLIADSIEDVIHEANDQYGSE